MDNFKIRSMGTNIDVSYKTLKWALKDREGYFLTIKKEDNDIYITLINNENKKIEQKIFEKDKGTLRQYIENLLTLNVISKNNNIPFEHKYLIIEDGVRYKINGLNNFINNFINKISKFDYMGKDENGDYYNTYDFNKQENDYYSIIESNILKYENKILDEDIKDTNYWLIPELYENKDKIEQLKKIRSKLFEVNDLKKIDEEDLNFDNDIEMVELKTQNINSKIISFGDIFFSNELKDKIIKIPIMQRNYIWTKELILKLFNDIKNAKNEHYINSIVYKEKNDKIEILDGQQRITSLLIILSSIFQNYKNKHGYKVPKLYKDLFCTKVKNKRNYIESKFEKISNGNDVNFFNIIFGKKKKLITGIKNKSVSGNEFITMNFDLINSQIKNDLKKIEGLEEENKYLDLLTNNILNLILITFTKNQIENSFEIFEKLNNSSISLNTIDLLKNFLLMFIIEDELDKYESEIESEFYKNVSLHFSNKNKIVDETKINKFVKYFISIRQIKKENLQGFDLFKSTIKSYFNFKDDEKLNKEEFIEKLRMLSEEIEIYDDLNENYKNENSRTYFYSDILSTFKTRDVYIPLIGFIISKEEGFGLNLENKKNREKVNKIREMLFEIEKFETFIKVLKNTGQSLSKTIEKIIENLNKLYEKNISINKENISEILKNKDIVSKNIYPLESFLKHIKDSSLANNALLTILNRINFWDKNNNKITFDTANKKIWHHNNPSLEHIMSQEQTDDQLNKILKKENINNEEFNIKRVDMLNNIGNILVIESSDNSKISNKDFYEKKKEYEVIVSKNDYFSKQFTKVIDVNSQIYSFEEIKERNNELQKILKEIYK